MKDKIEIRDNYHFNLDEPLFKSELKKYEEIWDRIDYSSNRLDSWREILKDRLKRHITVLDMGCGDGSIVNWLYSRNIKAVGLDLTLIGVQRASNKAEIYYGDYYAGTAWDMPFKDKSFDISISTDFLEHIPEDKIDKVISEIDRVTKNKTIHRIAMWEGAIYFGYKVHLTVKPIEWWRDKFNNCNCSVELFEMKRGGY